VLESVIKTFLASIIISFFLIISLRSINDSAQLIINDVKHSQALSELRNHSFSDPGVNGYQIVIGEGSRLTCKPSLISNHAGRVCIAT